MSFNDGAELHLVFPGLKAGFNNRFNRYQYDFRVDFRRPRQNSTTISHAEIVLDIYTKVIRKRMSEENARVLLKDIREGRIPPQNPYQIDRIPSDYVDRCRNVYKHNGKLFRPTELFELSPFQLSSILFFILVQEEANYPSYINGTRTSLSGRTLALDRYIEAIWVAAHAPHRLEEVLQRTVLEKVRPKRWIEIDYGLA